MTKKPLNPNAQKWVDALRSGKYKQGTNGLHDREKDCYCCLGVLCEVAIENGVRINKHPSSVDFWTMYDGDSGAANSAAMEFVGLQTRRGSFVGGTSLARLNDAGKTFLEIADLIESQPEGLFND